MKFSGTGIHSIKKRYVILTAAVLAIITPVVVQSATISYPCVGTVSQVTTDLSGNVNAGFNFVATGGTNAGSMQWQYICNVIAANAGVGYWRRSQCM